MNSCRIDNRPKGTQNLKMKIIADTHLGHTNMLLYEPIRMQKARMKGYEDFDKFLIEWLNDYIKKDDEVLHLGDVAFKDNYKYDKKTLSRTACLIKDINDKRILFSHYPVFNDNPFDEKYQKITELLQEVFKICNCDINIHGHTHSYCVNNKKCINACLEVNDFIPIEI